MYKDEEDYILRRLNELIPLTQRTEILYNKCKEFDDAIRHILFHKGSYLDNNFEALLQSVYEYPRVLREHLDIRDEIEFLSNKLRSLRITKQLRKENESGKN